LTTLAVPAATAAGTGCPPRADGPTPGETGAWPEDAATGEDPGTGAPGTPAAICASDDRPLEAGSAPSKGIVVGTTAPPPPPLPLYASDAAAPLVDDGIALHRRGLPLDYAASDVGSVQQWLQGRLDFAARVPRFRQGPALQGVRLSELRSRSAAALSYAVPQASGGRLTLLIVDDPDDVDPPGSVRRLEGRQVWLSRSRGYNVVSWWTNEIVYSLISDLDETDVLQLVQAVEFR